MVVFTNKNIDILHISISIYIYAMAPSQGHTSSSSCLVPLYSSILGCIHSTVIRKCNTCIYVSNYTYSDTHHMIPTSHITCITHSIRTITQFHPGRIQRQEEDREQEREEDGGI